MPLLQHEIGEDFHQMIGPTFRERFCKLDGHLKIFIEQAFLQFLDSRRMRRSNIQLFVGPKTELVPIRRPKADPIIEDRGFDV